MPRRRALIQMVLIGVVTGAVVTAAAVFIPWLPDAAAEQAQGIDRVYWVVTIICVAIFAVVAGVSIYAGWKFRAPPDDLEDGSPIHGHTGLEIAWTAVPAVLVTAIAIYSGYELVNAERAEKPRRIEVTAQQFAWSFAYPDLNVTSGELVVPVNEPVKLVLEARDVIHSFWVPEWRMKQDAVPGIATDLVVTPTKRGNFSVICTELCGLGHAAMRARAVVVTREEFDRWAQEQRQAAAAGGAAQGKQLFTRECASCHTLADAGTTAETGPDLDKVLPGKDAEYVREQIVNPNSKVTPGFQPNVMPQDFGERLSDAQVDSLVEYLLEATKKG